jgi:hypothetical protein
MNRVILNVIIHTAWDGEKALHIFMSFSSIYSLTIGMIYVLRAGLSAGIADVTIHKNGL